MIVVTVLMMSCQMLTLCSREMDGAHTTTSSRQNAKNQARLTIRDAASANRSNQPTLVSTSEGIAGFEAGMSYSIRAVRDRQACRSNLTGRDSAAVGVAFRQ